MLCSYQESFSWCSNCYSLHTAPQLIYGSKVDFIVFDYLSEITMSLLTAARRKAPVREIRIRTSHKTASPRVVEFRKGYKHQGFTRFTNMHPVPTNVENENRKKGYTTSRGMQNNIYCTDSASCGCLSFHPSIRTPVHWIINSYQNVQCTTPFLFLQDLMLPLCTLILVIACPQDPHFVSQTLLTLFWTIIITIRDSNYK